MVKQIEMSMGLAAPLVDLGMTQIMLIEELTIMTPPFLPWMRAVSIVLLSPLGLVLLSPGSNATAPVLEPPMTAGPSSVPSPGSSPILPPSPFLRLRSLVGQQPAARSPQPDAIAGLYVTPPNAAAPAVDSAAAFTLTHTDVNAQIQGNVARVELTQTFENPFDEPLEAVYVFPLPDEAAVDGMVMTVGDRTIVGEIKTREEAQAVYDEAVQQGRTAGLLEQERANIFTQAVANIRPGEQVDVTIRYTESLAFIEEGYEFVFPMVVGPRYIPEPATNDGNSVLDANRITPPVLPPGTRSGHDIDVTVAIDAGVPIQAVTSPSHKIDITPGTSTSPLTLAIAPNDTIPNKDLIVRYQVAGPETQATVLTDTTHQGGHFALYFIPAVEYASREIVPKDVVFLIDTSGSQSGAPLAQSKALMRQMVEALNPDDTFNIVDFANTTTRLSEQPLGNSSRNRARALRYIDELTANGGTELLNGIRDVLALPAADRDRLRSIVLLTDGFIGNESAVIADVQDNLAPGNRFYSIGVGNSVNRFLLNRLAEVGRGAAQVIRTDEPVEAIAETFVQRINNPVMTNITVTWEGAGTAAQLYPAAAPDLFSQEPLMIFGRKADGQPGQLTITGTLAGGRAYTQTIPIVFDPDDGGGAIAQLWARARIKDEMNQMYGGETVAGVDTVTQIALEYGLLSRYTAFVAVSEEVRVDPDGTRRTVPVPVELPEGVSYEGIFGPSSPPASLPSLSRGARRSFGRGVRSGGFRAAPMAPVGLTADSMAAESTPDEAMAADYMATIQVSDLADTLEGTILADLETQLQPYLAQALARVAAVSGQTVWRVRIRDGQVTQVLWDEAQSTVDDAEVLQVLRRSLQSWRPPVDLTATVAITVDH